MFLCFSVSIAGLAVARRIRRRRFRPYQPSRPLASQARLRHAFLLQNVRVSHRNRCVIGAQRGGGSDGESVLGRRHGVDGERDLPLQQVPRRERGDCETQNRPSSKFEDGTINFQAIACLGIGLDALQSLGMHAIQKHVAAVTALLYDGLSSLYHTLDSMRECDVETECRSWRSMESTR